MTTGEFDPREPRHQESDLAEAVTRAFWLSRLYPLRTLILDLERKHPRTIRLNRAERRRLRDKYGPRPYGPLPSWHRDPAPAE